MKVSVVYADANNQKWIHIDVPEETSAAQAIELSGLLKQFPEIDLEENRFGIFGRVVKAEEPLKDGDRVEIYRPITADPETVERRDQEDE
jgi:hypothetical protein